MKALLASILLAACSIPFLNREYQPNPDPNHTHADFAVWIEGMKLDLSDMKYMSGVSWSEESHDEENEYLHKHLHLHDNVGHVVHRHKPGYTLQEFFRSIGFEMSSTCFRMENGVNVCPEQGKDWQMFIRNVADEEPQWLEVPYNPEYVFKDMDQILLTYQAQNDEIARIAIEKQLKNMTEDSCLYSQTCPWKGDPPAENCIADPEVPCVAPLE